MQNKYAGFWARTVAISLDQIILGAALLFIMMQVSPYFVDLEYIRAASNKEVANLIELLENMVFLEIIAVIIWSAMCSFFYRSRWQATPGKKIMGMKLIRPDGDQISFRDAFLRTASLPIFLMMVQVIERSEIYSKLEQVRQAPQNYATIQEVVLFVSSSEIVAYSDLIVMMVGSFWLLLAAFTREKTAFHDILFNTRVIYAKN